MNSGQKLQWLALVAKTLPRNRTAFRVAAALAERLNSKTGQLNPSHQTLATDCGISERTSQRAAQELIDADLIEITRPGGKGRGSSNHYRLKGVTPVTLKPKKARHQRHPKQPVRVTNECAVRVTQMADESERMTPHTGAPLEAAPGAQKEKPPPGPIPTDDEIKTAREHIAKIRALMAKADA